MMAVVAVVVGVTVHGGSLRFLPEKVDGLPPSPDQPGVLATVRADTAGTAHAPPIVAQASGIAGCKLPAAGLKVFPSDLLLANLTFRW